MKERYRNSALNSTKMMSIIASVRRIVSLLQLKNLLEYLMLFIKRIHISLSLILLLRIENISMMSVCSSRNMKPLWLVRIADN